ncbi:hypothetical protein T484DRAFT_1795994 [Baffinella frigidus]|nr:hypothetical protein T484DRAFT_1795994 [Cryptophyta sp. CCMP2293]
MAEGSLSAADCPWGMGPESLSNQKYVQHRLRNMASTSYGRITPEDRPEDFTFLKGLVDRHRHAEKKMEGLQAFVLSDHDPREGARKRPAWKPVVEGKGQEVHLQTERDDGSKQDVSWRKCVTQKEKSPAWMLNQAMREAVQPQIDDKWCALRDGRCSKCCASGALEMDHVKQFSTLCLGFLQTANELPSEFDSAATTYRCKFLRKVQRQALG